MARLRSLPSPVRLEEIESRIVSARDLHDPVRWLLYGRSGSKKTRTGATAPGVVILDVNEKGTKSTRDSNPNVFPAEYWADVGDFYWYLAAGDHEYHTVLFDGVTAAQNLCMKFVLGDEAARDASRDPDMPSRTVWGKVGELMKTQITNYRNLPMNVVFTALQRSREVGEGEGEEGEILISPNCSPSIAGHLEAAVDVIGHLSTREVMVRSRKKDPENPEKGRRKKVIRTQMLVGPSERYVTKDRTGVLPPVIRNPDLGELFALIQGKEEE